MQLQPAVVVTTDRVPQRCIPTTRSPPATWSSTAADGWPPPTSTGAPIWRSSSTTKSPATAITLISASIGENVDRQDFDVIEEAKAVEALVTECGRADEAAKRLHKTEGWVSQRRALL